MQAPSDRIIVVDVGCRWEFAEEFLQDLDSFLVYGFDPDPEECARLGQQYPQAQITAIPLALGSRSEERTLYLTREPACSSLYQPDPHLTASHQALHCQQEVGQTRVQVRRLDEWAAEQGIRAIDHLKIDTQGSELDVLAGAGDLLQGLRSIQLEVEFNPLYLGQPLFSDIDGFLRSKGFVLWKLSEITHYSKNREAQPPIDTVDIRHDNWASQRIGVYAGQLFWANAHYVHRDVLRADKNPAYLERDRLLFALLGMPDVLGDQQDWGAEVAARIHHRCTAGLDQTSLVARLTARAAEAEARAAEAEAHATEAAAHATEAAARSAEAAARAAQAATAASQNARQLADVHASTSWRLTAPLRWLKKRLQPRPPGQP